MMAKFLALVNIRDVHLYHGAFQTPDTVLQRDTRMCVCASIEYNTVAIAKESRFLHLINQLSLHIALVIADLYVRKTFLQFRQIGLK